MTIVQVEFNAMITGLGMICAMVQGGTGYYAAYYKKKTMLLTTNNVLNRAHRAFGSFATTLYMLGLFAGTVGFVGAIRDNVPPLELDNLSFNIHTWGSFPVVLIFAWKNYLGYFKKQPLYGKRKWLGMALFLAWVFTWISAAMSYYLRTQPDNLQHPPPVFLLPYELLWLQLALPFIIGGVLGILIVRKAGATMVKTKEQAGA
ncbi:MAG: hypothetical protein AB1558_03410 [Thermodesulfobacteriota bacterium]